MQLAFDTTVLRALSMEKALEEISNAGYDHIEIGLAHFSHVDPSNEETAALRRALSDTSLKIAALCRIYPVSYPEEEVRAAGVQRFRKAIESAQSLDCDLIVSELNGDRDKKGESQIAFEKSMNELLPDLERGGITLCFEAHPGDFVESNRLGSDLIRKFGSKRLKYLYCAPHSFILDGEISEMIQECKDVLGYVHLADSLKPERTFFSGWYRPKVLPHQHLLPGKGDVDLPKLLKVLKEMSYMGFLSINPFSHFDKPLETLKESKREMDLLLEEN